MYYQDRTGRIHVLPSDTAHSHRLEPETVKLVLGGRASREELRRLLPRGAPKLLTDGRDYFAVPQSVLQEHPVLESTPARLPDHGRLVDFVLADFYAAELADPEVSRIHEHFSGVDTWGVAHRSQEAMGPVDDAPSLTYGDTAAPAVFRALRRVAACRRERFLDLGCGCGIPVLVAARLVGTAVGVDLLPGVVEHCRQAQAELGISRARFVVEDIRQTDLSSFDIVWVAATAFTRALRADLQERFEALRPGGVVISITHSFESPELRVVDRIRCIFPWTAKTQGRRLDLYFHLRR